MVDTPNVPEDEPISEEELEDVAGGMGSAGIPELGEAVMDQGFGEAG